MLRDALAPGSYLVLSHGTDEGTPEVARAVQNVYNRGGRTRRPRYRMIRTGRSTWSAWAGSRQVSNVRRKLE
jgi:hypothetical protein